MGIILIHAPPGTGKSSFMAAQGIDHMHGELAHRAIADCSNRIKVYQHYGFTHLTMPKKHLVYADFTIRYASPKCGHRVSRDIDGFKIGFPNEDFTNVKLPPCSFVILDEAQRYFDSRQFGTFASNVSRYYEQHRKFGLTFLISAQRQKLIDTNVRELASVILIERFVRLKDRNGKISRSVWTYWYWDTYLSFENGEKGHKMTYTFQGDIGKWYDTNEGEVLYLDGLDKCDFDYNDHKEFDYSPDGVREYIQTHKQDSPDGFRKKKKPAPKEKTA